MLFLEARYKNQLDRLFLISDVNRDFRVLKILGQDGEQYRYNRPNPWFGGARAIGYGVRGVTAAGLISTAAMSTAATTMLLNLSAAGLAGFFGATATESVVVGTATTTLGIAAAIAIPIVGTGNAVGGIVVMKRPPNGSTRQVSGFQANGRPLVV